MDTITVVATRIKTLCRKRHMTIDRLSCISGVSNSMIKGILYKRSKNPGVVTIKKICDGLNISLYEFFNTKEFENLEQEIKQN